MNLGLLDAACLAAVLEEAILHGEDPGDLKVLRRYERERKGDNVEMLVALDALHRWFGLPRPWAPLRALGLRIIDRAPPAKRWLMQRALGLNSRRKNLLPWSQAEGKPRIGSL
jgi:2-octaprenylphenol hydroxylase